MTTTVVKTVGTATRDYSTLQAWEDASPADLVAVDQIWQGQCYNDSEFTAGLSVAGTTTSATQYKELTVAAGQSFSDNASVQTNALRYNQANGVGLSVAGGYSTAIRVTDINFRMSEMQAKVSSDAYPYDNNTASTAHVLDKCIFQQSGSNGACARFRGGSLSNSLLMKNSAGTSKAGITGSYGAGTLTNCTIVRPTTYAAGGTGIAAGPGFTFTLKNCAVFGFTADTSGTISATTCYTDDSTPTTGFTTTTYDTSTGSGFQNTASTTADFRIKSGSALLDVGTTDTTYAANDIAGTARPQGSAYDVGCWELVVSGGVSLALTGQGISTSLGALSSYVQYGLSGQNIAASLGSLLANVSYPVTGQNLTVSLGSQTASVSAGILGQGLALALGTIVVASSGPVSIALTGQGITTSLGSLAADVRYTLSGQGVPISLGTIAASVNSALVGQQVSLTLGSTSASISTVLNGQSLVLAQSSLSPVITSSITGQSITASLGTVTPVGGTTPQYSKNSNLYYNIGNDLSIMLGSPTLATWNTAGRPAVGKLGLFGFNTETGKLEVYKDGAWVGILLT